MWLRARGKPSLAVGIGSPGMLETYRLAGFALRLGI